MRGVLLSTTTTAATRLPRPAVLTAFALVAFVTLPKGFIAITMIATATVTGSAAATVILIRVGMGVLLGLVRSMRWAICLVRARIAFRRGRWSGSGSGSALLIAIRRSIFRHLGALRCKNFTVRSGPSLRLRPNFRDRLGLRRSGRRRCDIFRLALPHGLRSLARRGLER